MLLFFALALLVGPIAAGMRPCTAGATECPMTNCLVAPCPEVKCCRFRPVPDTTEGVCMTDCPHGEVGDDWEPPTPTSQPTSMPVIQSCDAIETDFHAYMSAPERSVCSTDADCSLVAVGCAFGMSLGGCLSMVGQDFDRAKYNSWTTAWNEGGCCGDGCMICACMPPEGTICEESKCVVGKRVTSAPSVECNPDPDPRCTEEHDPVCADGVTYVNPCHAYAMCYTPTDWTVGACKNTLTEAPTEAPCGNEWSNRKCKKKLNSGQCSKTKTLMKCQKTCGSCTDPCTDAKTEGKCKRLKSKGRCGKRSVARNCKKTCGICSVP